MIFNDLNSKVKGRFSREIVIDDDCESITYIFPNTEEFIAILKRKMRKEKFASSQET
jgi:hypothetical protein